ncbi:MAG: alpha/beta hydrolase [Bacteroidaceae bacterium]|nr:alpha/beta hydrolase [Bacteroidaceae bacterium]
MKKNLKIAAMAAAVALCSNVSAKEVNSRIVDEGGNGKYKAIVVSDDAIPTHTIYRPQDLSAFKKNNLLPVLVWGNGGCANSSSGHINFLNQIASEGFIVIAIGPMPEERPQGGFGGGMGGGSTQSSQLTDAIDWIIAQNADKKSQYYGKIDTKSIAAAGMSCGGLQALEVSKDERLKTVMVCNSGIIISNGGGAAAPGGNAQRPQMPMMGGGMPQMGGGAPMMGGMPQRPQRQQGEQPQGDAPQRPQGGMPGGMPMGGGMPQMGGGAPMMGGMPNLKKEDLAKIHTPIIYILGGPTDIAYENGMDDFKNIDHVPAFACNFNVGHGGTYTQPYGGEFGIVASSWLKWQLKGDKEAGSLFTGETCGLSQREGWTCDKKNIP